jgi:hypothetical protein
MSRLFFITAGILIGNLRFMDNGLTWLFAFLSAIVKAHAISKWDHVVILANSRADESLSRAHYYAVDRGIPGRNIIAISMPADETISWSQYVSEIHIHLLSRLVADGWIGRPSAGRSGCLRPALDLLSRNLSGQFLFESRTTRFS